MHTSANEILAFEIHLNNSQYAIAATLLKRARKSLLFHDWIKSSQTTGKKFYILLAESLNLLALSLHQMNFHHPYYSCHQGQGLIMNRTHE